MIIDSYSTPWRLVHKRIYWLSDGHRDLQRIAYLLHQSLVEVKEAADQLVSAGFLVFQTPNGYMQRQAIDTRILMLNMKLLRPVQTAFVERFFSLFFQIAPNAQCLFMKNGVQQMGDSAMLVVGTVIESLAAEKDIAPVLRWLGQRHAKYHVDDIYFRMAGDVFIRTLREFLTQNFTIEAEVAWRALYEEVTHGIVYYMRNL